MEILWNILYSVSTQWVWIEHLLLTKLSLFKWVETFWNYFLVLLFYYVKRKWFSREIILVSNKYTNYLNKHKYRLQ